MQSASSSCFSLGSTSCKTNSTSQFGHKIFLKLFAACFLKQSFHYLEETLRDTLSNLSLIKTNIRPGQARYISALFSSCFCLAQAPAGNGHSKASLELPLFAEVLALLGGEKCNTENQKWFSMMDGCHLSQATMEQHGPSFQSRDGLGGQEGGCASG